MHQDLQNPSSIKGMEPPPSRSNNTKDNATTNHQSSTTIAVAIAGTVVIGTFGLMAPFVSGLRHKVFLPYMATPKYKVRAALQHAMAVPSRVVQPCRFLDLGSGDGEAVYQAVQEPTLDQAVGIELNPTLFGIASLRRLTWTSDQRRRSRFLCHSFWDHSLTDYSIIMIFGVPPLMKDLSDKIHRECKAGTVILSYRFPLPLEKETDDKERMLTMLRHEDEMFTYVLASDGAPKDDSERSR